VNTYIDDLISRYSNKGLVIDANLFILYLVGIYDTSKIKRFKRIEQFFTLEDFDLLYNLINNFKTVITTPNILTEVSNLTDMIKIQPRKDLITSFQKIIHESTEEYITSIEGCKSECFSRLGLSDSVISVLSEKGYLILTVDLDLYLYLESKRLPVINFNHLRQALLY
jgi:hypothetical protein